MKFIDRLIESYPLSLASFDPFVAFLQDRIMPCRLPDFVRVSVHYLCPKELKCLPLLAVCEL